MGLGNVNDKLLPISIQSNKLGSKIQAVNFIVISITVL